MSTKILFVVPYPHDTAPSQRLKFEQYYTALEKAGYEITIAPFIDLNFWKIIYKSGFYRQKVMYTLLNYARRLSLLSRLSRYDLVYVHLWATPFGPPLYERLLRKFSKRLIYDIDDLIYQGGSSPNNRSIRFLKTSAKVDFLMKHADRVLVSTEKLMDYTRQFTTRVSLIPATVDVKKYGITSAGASAPVVIGWSGSHTTSKYLHLLDEVLRTLSERHDIRILVMGDPDFAIEGLPIEILTWSAAMETENLLQFDIGLHPVPDEEWVYGKSGGKLVQYMAAGIPIVASAVGPNFKVVQDGYNGFLVNSAKEWIDRLDTLITNKKLRNEMGQHSKRCAIEIYSVEANLSKYLQALKE
ncbi:glycosyltransferase [Pedobacter sp. L105]|uniref:glycosyltransferase n=1 Tax=Pedobacter sp. L105 TaxID=1641871 RepID=UPI00131D74A0|nr:glycosyltransferase [Pedobacter sp. L105]